MPYNFKKRRLGYNEETKRRSPNVNQELLFQKWNDINSNNGRAARSVGGAVVNGFTVGPVRIVSR